MLNKITILSLVAVFSLMILTTNTEQSFAAEPSKALNKAEIDKLIHSYIMENPTVILQSVENYQKRDQTERRAEGIKKNSRLLFNDPTTPYAGNPNGDVTVIEFFDYNCGYCKRVWPEIAQLLDNDSNVKFLMKDYPILGPSSELASKWALASHKQGKYFEFHKALIDSKGAVNEKKLEKIAKTLSLDISKMKKDVQSDDVALTIQKNRALAVDLGITGTPAFLVNEAVAPGAVSYSQLKSMVEEERRKQAASK